MFPFIWVYPRACGETVPSRRWTSIRSGLSPRVRGNPLVANRVVPDGGSIPARAGKPATSLGRMECLRVYPRACGETFWVNWFWLEAKGLSPRVRGNPQVG